MHFCLGEYEKRNRNKALNLHRLPLRRRADPTKWKRNNPQTKPFPQDCCEHRQYYHKSKVQHHYQCLNYLEHIESVLREHSNLIGTDDQNTYIKNTYTQTFHRLSNDERLRFLSQLIRWVKPDRDVQKLRTNLYDSKHPNCYHIVLNGYYGFDECRICAVFLRHLLAISYKQMRSMFTKIWMSRRNGLLLPR